MAKVVDASLDAALHATLDAPSGCVDARLGDEVGDGARDGIGADIGDSLEQMVRAVAEATDNRPLADATHVLHAELTTVGVAFDSDWCRHTLQALRRGQPVAFNLG